MPGEKPYGFHEGSRSEYLAQYVFGSWGTAVVIPQQEDHGLDLHCTLMERIGGRFLAKCPYTVQVKSTLEPVEFKGEDAVRWLIQHPLPLFLCIVDKATARISIYHTLPRFQIWSVGVLPQRLSIVPEPYINGRKGECLQWLGDDEENLSISQPILEFSVNDMLNESFWDRARTVFEQWIEVENHNLTLVRMRFLNCRFPDSYVTNQWTERGWSYQWGGFANADQFKETLSWIKEPLEWAGNAFRKQGDLIGAAKASLFHRHIFGDECSLLQFVNPALNDRLNLGSYAFAGVDHLAEILQNALGESKTTERVVFESVEAEPLNLPPDMIIGE
jgi:hypothetical protein